MSLVPFQVKVEFFFGDLRGKCVRAGVKIRVRFGKFHVLEFVLRLDPERILMEKEFPMKKM